MRPVRLACRWPRSSPRRPTPTVLGAPFMIVTEVQGETIARRILRDERFAAARAALAGPAAGRRWPRCTRSTRRAVPGLEASDQVDAVPRGPRHRRRAPSRRSSWRSAGWRPTGRRRAPSAVVHGDFRLGNLIVGDDGLRAVLDWELAHLGDPMEDLGWLCVKAWRFGSPLPVAGVGDVRGAVRRLRGGVGPAGRPRGGPLVGGARHAEVGDHVHHAGQRPPHRRRCGATSWPPSAGGCARTSTTCSSC